MTSPIALFDIQGRSAFVTGAATGIGRAVAEVLVHSGCHVMLFDRDGDGVAKTAQDLQTKGLTVLWHAGDVSIGAQVTSAAQALVDATGRLDIAVANAGIGDPDRCRLHETTDKGWARTLAVNLDGVYHTCRAVLPQMLAQQSGSIITVASMFGLVASAGMIDRPAYSATKGAVVNLTRELALSYVRDGIRANALCPGCIRTPNRPSNAQVAKQMQDYTPMGRLGSLEELKGAVLYLASDASSFATGTTMVVDGGVLAR